MWTTLNSPDRFCDVAKSVHGGSPDSFLVGFEEFQQLKTDAHPLLGCNILCPSVSDATNQIYAILLHFLVPVRKGRGRSERKGGRSGKRGGGNGEWGRGKWKERNGKVREK